MAAKRKDSKLRSVKNATGLPIAFDPVMLPLGRAKAVLRLLNQIEGGHIEPAQG